ncbi:MAG: ribosomal RNA small subunit methyltransferase A [Euryarchaeota archaeon]|nr:ribosomal RNA small subunit methyltransferase A [Euryarchaeota archaeon]
MSLLQETKLILRRYGIKPSRKLGQHFLVSERIIEREVEVAELSGGERVLEIGAGIGNLTGYLLEAGCEVVVVERDPLMVRVLRERFPGEKLRVVCGDATRVELPPFDKVVANLPFSISSPITFRLLRRGFERAVLIYQLEFARRLVAEPGTREYSRVSAACRYYARARLVQRIPRGAFYPPPEVEAALVELVPVEQRPDVDEEFFLRFLAALFPYRRKKLRRALALAASRLFGMEEVPPEVDAELLERRVFQLTPEELARIGEVLRRWSTGESG